MENYISINGVPVIGNHKILQQLLREDLDFEGLAVSDFGEFGDTQPLSNSASIFLTGLSAHNIGNQCGDWSVGWHGHSGNTYFPNGISVKEGLQAIAGECITYFNGLHADGTYSEANLTAAKDFAREAEYTIAVIGEEPYAEKSRDIDDLAPPIGQIEYVKELASCTTRKSAAASSRWPRTRTT
ncbi:unnamed protein product [Phytophthora lilii]|uniref:beta-glucosidase n=1 Tax=Phytophthora lilii TaxID=2077276 RepID=A0A9W6WYF0_9STRA|nr:unnamed protein product [Phytophthora lilii]